MNRVVRKDLSIQAKQTFQVVALLATILVVGIHYQSDVPDQPSAAAATWNELGQEFLFGGIGRVAVPMFAFAAGLFYFRSDDGSFASYRRKLQQRLRTVLLPFFIIGSLAMAAWLIAQRMEGDSVALSPLEFLGVWLLHPPAEQLWFLRDLIVLVLLAPVIRWTCQARVINGAVLCGLTLAWLANWQFFPVVAGWRLLHLETLLFFSLGCLAVSRTDWIESVGKSRRSVLLATCGLWWGLIVMRISVRADFDLWYARDFGTADLLMHQLSIVVGCAALFMIAWRIRCDFLIRLSGASFFIYLVHEFPLRAIVQRLSDRFLEESTSCWVLTPLVLLGCWGAMTLLNRSVPSLVAVVTGGRTPTTAVRGAPVGGQIYASPRTVRD